jgi:hypothetical protein
MLHWSNITLWEASDQGPGRQEPLRTSIVMRAPRTANMFLRPTALDSQKSLVYHLWVLELGKFLYGYALYLYSIYNIVYAIR